MTVDIHYTTYAPGVKQLQENRFMKFVNDDL